MKTFALVSFVTIGLLASNVAAGDIPSSVRTIWRDTGESGDDCTSVDLSDLDSDGKGKVEICAEGGCPGPKLESSGGTVVEDGWYCFDTEDSFFAINPDDEKGTYPDGCSKADIDDTTLSTYKKGDSCGAFQTLMTLGAFGTISAFILSIMRAGIFSQ